MVSFSYAVNVCVCLYGNTLSHIGSTDQWQIHSGLDGHIETITLSNHAVLHAGDFGFV